MASSNSSMFLWWGSGSLPCMRVMLALEEKGLGGYPNKLISFGKNEHKADDIMKINPRGQVPTFFHGDIVVNESMAICDYLESTFADQGTKLMPGDPGKKALVLQRTHETLNLNKHGTEGLVYFFWETKEEDRKQELMEKKQQALRDELALWEGYLEKLGDNSYIAGPDYTMADVCFWPYIAFFGRVGLKMEKYPRIKAYFEKVRERPSSQASWPPHWSEPATHTILENI